MLSHWHKAKKEKLQELNKQFQGLKGEYQLAQERLRACLQWRLRLKFAERVWYAGLLSLGFVAYKSPGLSAFLFRDAPLVSIPLLSGTVIVFHFLGACLGRKERLHERRAKKLKEQLKSAKRMLVSNMDPLVVEVVKEIVREDMKLEVAQMRSSDEGCSQKCILVNKVLSKDLERNQRIVQAFANFKWCNTCKNLQPGAVQVCHAGCGQKVFKECVPLMNEFGKAEAEIAEMKQRARALTEQSMKFIEFQKAKR